ncbi:hypothetical protein [Paenibacillus caui]|nr:hypothetical protein [Paenibacillus caui]
MPRRTTASRAAGTDLIGGFPIYILRFHGTNLHPGSLFLYDAYQQIVT